MKHHISNITLSKLSRIISERTALHFPEDVWSDLANKLYPAIKEFGYDNFEEFASYLESASLTIDQIEILAGHLTIGETYFWREPQSFDALEKFILPELINSRINENKKIKIWSAGCSSGEEPYSIAIALKRLLPDIKDWNITIRATDINPGILRKAINGIYGKWSFRNVPDWLQNQYFIKREENKFEVIPDIKSMIEFSHLNLAEANYSSSLKNLDSFDLIFCRNVLMYFDKERTNKIVDNFYDLLADKGWLVVSACELSQQIFSRFVSVNFPGAVFYKKDVTKSKTEKNFTHNLVSPAFDRITKFKKSAKKEVEIKHIQPLIKKQKIEVSISEIPGRTFFEECVYLYSNGLYSEVINKLSKVASSSDESTLLIKALANKGDIKEAIIKCEEAITKDKLNLGLHYLCATILIENNETEKAISALKKVNYLNPDFVLADYTLGNIYLKQTDFQKAKKHFENALTILKKYNDNDEIAESDGITAGRLKEIINNTINLRVK